uniref:Nucleoprotein n=1 Tax=Bat coronavirus Hipposideros/GhanaBoo/344/2008 TaxID=622707 RepID=C0LI68_9NIDO|nr:nucleoprotein [Bat coronavirus Hipposideros/GhanaBoo/344/2008]
MATVNWADESEQQRGRQGRIPYSLYRPLLVDSEQPWKVIPRNLVPTNKKDKSKLIGYWNVQKRFRTRKGQRVDLSPKLHFYYLGTGPHQDAKFRDRREGVIWVAIDGAKTEPTGYGVRRKNADPEEPRFNQNLPNGVSVVEEPDSRGPSRSQSRSQSRGRGASKPQSRNTSTERSQGSNQEDILKAVAAALKSLGFEKPQEKDQKTGRKATPKPSRSQSPVANQSRSKSPARSASSDKEQKHEMQKPRWKRQPNSDKTSNVTQCFGPRDFEHNFGNLEVLANGVKAKGYPQFAELVPSTAAMLFDSHIDTKEEGDSVVLTYTTRVKVPKDHPNLGKFLEQLNAFTKPSSVKETQSHPMNPAAPEFSPIVPSNPEPIYDAVAMETDIIDEVN